MPTNSASMGDTPTNVASTHRRLTYGRRAYSRSTLHAAWPLAGVVVVACGHTYIRPWPQAVAPTSGSLGRGQLPLAAWLLLQRA
ncbi:hypothetical protein B296_00023640 [Ensete ventricosum]|uniref:Uncharacterized protein n=1 Tax=Ensete ventricosum TaxID=4639 RepID=A0A427A303_ENSVE|nr:hypothetical protein B296_00023640 [Ensete ventricosum]